MIGGTDIIVRINDAQTAMDLAVRAALLLWRRAVIEDADSGETFADYRDIVLAARREILVYRGAAAQAAWRELGPDESLDGTMIHLIADDDDGELTIAVDDVPTASIRSFITAVRDSLRNDLFACRAEHPGKVAA